MYVQTVIRVENGVSTFFLPLNGETHRIKLDGEKGRGRKQLGAFASILSHPSDSPSYDWFPMEELHFAIRSGCSVYVKGIGRIQDVFQLFQLLEKKQNIQTA